MTFVPVYPHTRTMWWCHYLHTLKENCCHADTNCQLVKVTIEPINRKDPSDVPLV